MEKGGGGGGWSYPCRQLIYYSSAVEWLWFNMLTTLWVGRLGNRRSIPRQPQGISFLPKVSSMLVRSTRTLLSRYCGLFPQGVKLPSYLLVQRVSMIGTLAPWRAERQFLFYFLEMWVEIFRASLFTCCFMRDVTTHCTRQRDRGL
jgi:hypothetical protein